MTEKKKASSIAAALVAAQSEIGRAEKTSVNPHFRSKYADLAAVMDACIPALNSHGIAVIQPLGEDERGRYVDTVFIHAESGETLSGRVPLIVQKNDMQGYGSAVTYARRYGLMALAGVAPEDDDGNAAAKAAPPPFNPEAAAKRIEGQIAKADSLDRLSEIWTESKATIAQIKSANADAFASLNAAKEGAKMRLIEPTGTSADLGGDHIPY